MTQHVALVLGDVSMVRALGRAGIPVVLASSEHAPIAGRSRWCQRVLRISADPDEAAAELAAWAKREPARPVIFYQGDGDLLLVSRHRDALRRHAHLVLPAADLVEDLVDKLRFAGLAERLALPVPPTALVMRDGSTDDVVEAWSRFPCVLKPAVRREWLGSALQQQNGGVGKALRLESRDDLVRVLPSLRAHDTDCVLQAAVEGGEDRILSYHAYVREDGERVVEFTGRKVRTRPRQYGYSTCVAIAPDAEVRALGREIIQKLRFTGVLKMDFKRDARDGRLFLLEINPRFNLWHHLAAVAGASIPALVYEDCVRPGARSEGPPLVVRDDVVWMSTRGDLRALLEYRRAGEHSLRRWLREAVTADVHEDLDWRDPLPFFADLLARARQALPSRAKAARA